MFVKHQHEMFEHGLAKEQTRHALCVAHHHL